MAVIVLWGSVAHASQECPHGDALVQSSISDALTLVPVLASDSTSSDVAGMIFNGLVKYDRNVELVGDLAESWDIVDGGREIVFHLRKGVRWHDGAPFTAADVAFTYRVIVDPKTRTPYSGDFERIEKLEVVDDATVKVIYKEPFSPALASWGMWIMPEHILAHADINNTPFARHPVGTGPYRFKSWRTGQKIELVANKDYFEGRPCIDRVIYRIIPDEATTFLELETKGLDLSLLTPLQFTKQTDGPAFRRDFRKYRYPGFGYSFMAYNLSNAKFRDVRVREAIEYAVDKEEIVRTIFFGLARVTTGPFMMDSWAYNHDVKALPYDPAKARSLLAEAGWKDTNGDGTVDRDGIEFDFTVLLNQGNAERMRAAEMIQRYLAAVGIRMRIRVLEWSALINEFINKRAFEAVIMGWFLTRDPDIFDIWHSSKTRNGEFNFIGYRNEEVDRLLVEGRRIFDRGERAAIYRKIHEIIYDDHPYLFLYNAEMLPIVSSRIRGVETSPIGIGFNLIKWYVPKDEQRYMDIS